MSTTEPNPSAYSDLTDFPVPDGMITIAKVASNRAISNLTARLKPHVGELAAAAVAEVIVDPARARNDLADGQFEYQDTPSGRQLVCLRADAWTPGLSPDGANGRSRLSQQRSGDVDPWPLPSQSGVDPVLVYRVKSLERLAKAAAESGRQIITTDMITRVRSNPRGIWNPPLVVAGVADVEGDEPVAFVHASEGSTRIGTAHHVVGTDDGAAVTYAGRVRELIRSERARVASALAATPGSKQAQDAAKLLSCPIRVVIGVIDENGNPCNDPFDAVIAEYVESVHEEPRPWDELAQGNAVGERLMLRLNQEGILGDDALADILQRDDFYASSANPSEIGLQIARVATLQASEPVLREVILSDPNAKHLTGRRKAAALAPLYLRAHRRMAGLRESAAAALSRPFLPQELSTGSWNASGRSVDELQTACEQQVNDSPGAWNDDLRELCARAVGPVAALGLVLSDQGQAVDDHKELRGHVSEVIEGLAMSIAGIRVMADAIRRADGVQPFLPVRRNVDGSPVTVDDRDGNRIPVHHDPANRQTNIHVRALALNEGVIPSNSAGKPKPPTKTAEERFRVFEDEFVQLTGQLLKTAEQLGEVLGTDGRPVIEMTKLNSSKFAAVPERLTQALQFVLQNRGPDVPDPDGEDSAAFAHEGDEDDDEDEDEDAHAATSAG